MFKLNYLHIIIIGIIGICIRGFELSFSCRDTFGDELMVRAVSSGMYYCYDTATTELRNKPFFTTADFKREPTFSNIYKEITYPDGGNQLIFHVLMGQWTSWLGFRFAAMRSLNIIFYILLFIVGYLFGKKIFKDDLITLIILIGIALSPALIHIGREARSYTLACLTSFWGSYLFYLILKAKELNYVHLSGYIVSVLLSFFSHFSTVYIYLAHALVAATQIRKSKIKILISGGITVFVVGAVILFWYYNGGKEGLEMISLRNEYWLSRFKSEQAKLPPGEHFFMLTNYRMLAVSITEGVLMSIGFFLQTLKIKLIYLLPVVIFILYLIFIYYKLEEDKLRAFFILLCSLSGIVFAGILALRSGHMISFYFRYLSFSFPYFILMISYILKSLKVKLYKIILATVFIICWSVSIYSIYIDTAPQGFGSRKIADTYADVALELQHINPTPDTIIYSNWHTAQQVNFFLTEPLTQVPQKAVKFSARKDTLPYINYIRNSKYYPFWVGDSLK